MTTDTHVPDDESPVVCSYCERPFASEEFVSLHAGLEHYEELAPDEREAYAEAYAAETDELRYFRLKALAALLVIYFGLLFVYAGVT